MHARYSFDLKKIVNKSDNWLKLDICLTFFVARVQILLQAGVDPEFREVANADFLFFKVLNVFCLQQDLNPGKK